MSTTTALIGNYLSVWGLRKVFGAYTALDEIAFDVAKGEMVCLLGPSGCGKTTALRIIAGLEEHDSGRVFIAGRDVSALPVSRRNVGIVFQSYALFPNLTAEQNVAYGLSGKGRGRRDIRLRALEMLDMVGLSAMAAKYPAQLSGGQQQRVALARAVALSPDILLLDEPLSALDAQVRMHLRTEIKRLQRDLGVTTILVTHDQEEALTMADRIVLMNKGKVVQDAPPGLLYDHPATPFAAAFLGSMNFLPVQPLGEGTTLRLGAAELVAPKRAEGPGSLAIRPEDVVVSPPDEHAPPGGNRLLCRVRGLEFRGPLYRLSLRPEGLGEDAPPLCADVSARLAARLDLGENARVVAHLPVERLHFYAA